LKFHFLWIFKALLYSFYYQIFKIRIIRRIVKFSSQQIIKKFFYLWYYKCPNFALISKELGSERKKKNQAKQRFSKFFKKILSKTFQLELSSFFLSKTKNDFF